MSYDVHLYVHGAPRPIRVEELDWVCTSNVQSMWRRAMPATDGLAGLHGMGTVEAAAALRAGIAAMEADPAAYRAKNPASGWGDFDSQLVALRELLATFVWWPEATVHVTW